MENQPTITKTTVECYKIRGSHGLWSDITIDSNGNAGRIQIASDYGDWQYYWGSCGCPFKEFLIGLSSDMHYTAGKFGAGKWFDHDATMKSLRKDLEDYDGSKEIKDAMREQLDELDGCDEVNTFCTLAYNADDLNKLWDTGPHIHYDVSPMFKQFWKRIWPVFTAELKKDIEAYMTNH